MHPIAFTLTLALIQASGREFRLDRVPDSSPVFRAARNAQGAFESDRLRLLPSRGGSGGRCDERIGRFCYWYDEADTALPEEPE